MKNSSATQARPITSAAQVRLRSRIEMSRFGTLRTGDYEDNSYELDRLVATGNSHRLQPA